MKFEKSSLEIWIPKVKVGLYLKRIDHNCIGILWWAGQQGKQWKLSQRTSGSKFDTKGERLEGREKQGLFRRWYCKMKETAVAAERHVPLLARGLVVGKRWLNMQVMAGKTGAGRTTCRHNGRVSNRYVIFPFASSSSLTTHHTYHGLRQDWYLEESDSLNRSHDCTETWNRTRSGQDPSLYQLRIELLT